MASYDFTTIGYPRQIVSFEHADVKAGQATASGDTTILAAPGAGFKLLVLRVEVSNSHASVANVVGVKTASLNSGAVFGKKYLPALGGMGVTVGAAILCGENELLALNLSTGSATVEWTVYYKTVGV